RERPLQQVLEVGALSVLDVINMPSTSRCSLNPPFEAEKPPCLVDVARLRRSHENGIDPLHRHDAYNAGKRAFAISPKNLFEFGGELVRCAITGRKQRVRLASERID